jgi:hypothetical protein
MFLKTCIIKKENMQLRLHVACDTETENIHSLDLSDWKGLWGPFCPGGRCMWGGFPSVALEAEQGSLSLTAYGKSVTNEEPPPFTV